MTKKSAGQRCFERFKGLCQGYSIGVDLAGFHALRAMKGRTEWTEAEEIVLGRAVGRGAGPALEDLYAEHPRWRALVSSRGWRVAPEPLTAGETERVMDITLHRMSRWTCTELALFVRNFLGDIEAEGAQPAEAQLAEAQLAEAQPAEAQVAEAQLAEAEPTEAQLAETRATEARAAAESLCCVRLPPDEWVRKFTTMYRAAGPAGRALVKSRVLLVSTRKLIANCIDENGYE